MQSRYFTINDIPQGTPSRELFELHEAELPDLAEGEVRIRNTWLSVDPYMRGRMSGVKTYIDPFVIGDPLEGAAVGSLAVQLAKAKGGTVVGIAGSPEKLEWLEYHGIKAVSYRDRDAQQLTEALKAACPEGFDVYYENVGGVCLEAALNTLKVGARIAVCGMIARYNEDTPSAGPGNLAMILIRRARMEGFIVFDHWERYPQFLEEVGPQVESGQLDYEETVEDGLERTPDAFLKLFEGANRGKMLVRL
jgi:hypothetical protein